MHTRAATWLAWSLCALTLALIVSAIALSMLNRYGVRDLGFLFAEVAAALVGGLVASHRPKNPVGWFILGHALCFTLGEFSRQYAIYGVLTQPDSLPAAEAAASPPYWIWFPGILLMFVFLPLYFPNGRLLSPRWRPVAWLAVFAGLVATSFAMFRPAGDETRGIPNPLGIERLEGLEQFAGILSIFISASWLGVGAAAAVSLVVRFRRSGGEERQQIKWVAYAIVLLISFSFLDQLSPELLPPVVDVILSAFILTTPWVAIAIAVFRYRLFDIDVVINRTLVYGSLTATLALVYLGGVATTQALFCVLTGHQEQPQLAIVVSTLVIAALFNPLRRRIQAFIDRRFYRRKYDAAKTLEAFAAKLRDETDLDALSDDLVGVVRETMQPAHVSLWLRPETTSKGKQAG